MGNSGRTLLCRSGNGNLQRGISRAALTARATTDDAANINSQLLVNLSCWRIPRTLQRPRRSLPVPAMLLGRSLWPGRDDLCSGGMRAHIPGLPRSSHRRSRLEKRWSILRWPQVRAGAGTLAETRHCSGSHAASPPGLFLVAALGFTWMLSRWKRGWCDPAGLVKVKLATTWLGDGPQAAVCRGLGLSQACVQMTILQVRLLFLEINGDFLGC